MTARATTACAAALVACTHATASISLYTEAGLYNAAVAGMNRATETFGSFADGTYPSPLSGTASPVTWTATAGAGLLISSGRLSTVGGQDLLVSFSAGALPVRGVSGNFFATASGTVTAAIVTVTLNDGTAQVELVNDPGAFMGFMSSSASISSILVSVTAMSGTASPTLDNLDFAYVPAPGSITLLAMSLLVVRRRRR